MTGTKAIPQKRREREKKSSNYNFIRSRKIQRIRAKSTMTSKCRINRSYPDNSVNAKSTQPQEQPISTAQQERTGSIMRIHGNLHHKS